MTIELFGGTKGGPGKTTVAINVAIQLATLGHAVCIVDADKQRSAAKWHARRIDNEIQPALTLVEKRGNVNAALRDLDEHYDFVIVDVAGDDNQEMRTAMTAAHRMIVVLQPSQLDVETLEDFTEVIDTAKDFNPALEVRSLINQAPTNHNETETSDVSEFIVDFSQITPIETILARRKAYRDTLAGGKGVVELTAPSAKKARIEIEELVEEVFNR
ncbi:AAA family ATPase [Rathayibacter rathayi]|uniref:AAA family ATPase n=1 Tax=Rathayibacter rathayi TaxID=33887 RepID=UPI000BD4655E|nr:AAA family ATPase [Rathayibacter rathayi]MWV75847.1 AAA family ATPase [Rathayibacter rathayi NCPPB 2980 = VKM Ac-1601]TWD63641.1 plasmid segregation oscillating ATPase ParF [Rathayibacter rathayi]SOE05852.1 plasmid segregation oscillating ATPase ParF [Rathayibacter rathayi NCPPB 2980 = VKM Ac-1601]